MMWEGKQDAVEGEATDVPSGGGERLCGRRGGENQVRESERGRRFGQEGCSIRKFVCVPENALIFQDGGSIIFNSQNTKKYIFFHGNLITVACHIGRKSENQSLLDLLDFTLQI